MSDVPAPWFLSRRLLGLLDLIGDPALLDYLEDLWRHYPVTEPEEDAAATRRGQELMRELARVLVESKLQPALRSFPVMLKLPDLRLDLPLETLRGAVSDELLDEHFTRAALAAVPAIVFRWKELRQVLMDILPDHRVMRYMREATISYIYGLPGAAAVLCRAALESALTDALVKLEVVLPPNLSRRIDLAHNKGLLTPEMKRKAFRVKAIGDETVHSGGCSEVTAREQIRRAAEVIQHLYSAPRSEETTP